MGCVLLVLGLPVKAQKLFTLTAEEVRVDSVLPEFTWQKQLGTDFADSVYAVSIEYPEFIDMSEGDIGRYQTISGAPLPELPEVSASVGVARKQGMLDVAFVPLVFRDGKYQKLVTFKLNVTASPKQSEATTRTSGDADKGTLGDADKGISGTAGDAEKGTSVAADDMTVGNGLTRSMAMTRSRTAETAAGRYAAHSVLQNGTWAKIRIPQSGFYQLTDALIKKAGFTDPSRVKLYGYGGALQPEQLTGDYLTATDDLQEVPTCTIDGRRLFYGVGPVGWESADTDVRTRNPYSDDGYYFLTEGDSTLLTVDQETFVAAHYPTANDYHSLYETDDYAWYHGGRNLFDKQLYTIGTPQHYQLEANGETGTLTVAITYNGSCAATVAVNDSVVGTISRSVSLDSYTEAEETVWQFKTDNLVAGQNDIAITQTSGADMRLDYLSLRLDTPLAMTDLQTPALPEPEYLYQITNQDHHADEAADMIIIIPTTQLVAAQAERLKAWHETNDSLRVRIVPADELYNEFSSGTPDATAYRRYMKMLYDRADTEADIPRYLLLFGDGAWDNRMKSSDWTGYSPDDFLLCFESENSFSHVSCYVSDDFFCLLDDGEQIQQSASSSAAYMGKPDVAVGRLPARDADEAKVLVDKILDYAANSHAGAWQNVICVMGDDGNSNTHMATADRVATQVENNYPGYLIKKIYWDAYQRTSSATGYSYPEVTRLIKQQITDGALMMNYSGHGAPYALSHELVMKLADFESATSPNLPLWVTASCDIMPFDGQEANIGETVMLNSQGGGIAFFGTTRTVYASYNEAMNLVFTNYVLKQGYTIGEAVRQAKCDLVDQGRDTSPNKLQYSLLGDPALRLACPVSEVVVDSINGLPVGTEVTLNAGSTARISGHIARSGAMAADYSGVVTATVRDAEETITCQLNDTSSDGADVAFTYTDRTKTLYQGSDSISQGRFHMTFAVPKDISYTDGNGLMTLYAADHNTLETAHGQTDSFVLSASGIVSNDSIGPSIYCYLNTRAFTNGDQVNATPYFRAELYDESGINASGSSIGHDLELVIDGELAQTYNLNDYFTFDFGDYRSGAVGYTIPKMSVGQHRLLFRAWDVLNNSSTAQLTFEVVDNLSAGDISVICTKNPAVRSTSFIVSHGISGSEAKVVMDVFDFAGRQLYKRTVSSATTDGTSTIDWDLRLSGGGLLQTGVYLCRFQVNDGASKTVKLIVLRQ